MKSPTAADASAVMERRAAQNDALAAFMDAQPFSQSRYEDEMLFLSRQHALSAFELGKRLVVYREKVEPGHYETFVRDQLHYSPGYARNLVAFARVCVEVAARSKGLLDLDKLAAMDHRKVLLLGEVSSEYAEELAESGTIGGHAIDELDALSRDELRDEITRLRSNIDKGRDQLIKAKEKTADLDAQLRELREVKKGAVAKRAQRLTDEVAASCSKFRETLPRAQTLGPDDKAALYAAREGLLRIVNATVEWLTEQYPELLDDISADDQRRILKHLDSLPNLDAEPTAPIRDIHRKAH